MSNKIGLKILVPYLDYQKLLQKSEKLNRILQEKESSQEKEDSPKVLKISGDGNIDLDVPLTENLPVQDHLIAQPTNIKNNIEETSKNKQLSLRSSEITIPSAQSDSVQVSTEPKCNSEKYNIVTKNHDWWFLEEINDDY